MNQQKSTQQENASYVGTLKKIVFIPAILTAILGAVMVVDYYSPLVESKETLIQVGKREVYLTAEGHKFLSGYYTYYAFEEGEICKVYHTPILHVVTEVADNFEGHQWDHYLVWHFYVGNAIYAHILFLFSLFIVVKRNFSSGVYYVAYFLLLFIGLMLWIMLWP